MNEELLQSILYDLHNHVEGVEYSAIIQQNGTLLANFPGASNASDTVAILKEFATLTDDVCQVLEKGPNTEAILKGQNRFVALYRTSGKEIILGIVGQAAVNFGLLNSGCRIAIEKIETLVSPA